MEVLNISHIVMESIFRARELLLGIQKIGEERFRNTEMLLHRSFSSNGDIHCDLILRPLITGLYPFPLCHSRLVADDLSKL